MDVLGKRGSLEKLGRLSSIWTTTAVEPVAGPPVAMPDIEGQRSDKLDLSIGLKILGNALQGLGASAPSLASAFQRARKVQFAFTNVTSTSVSPLEAGKYLSSGDLDAANPLVAPYFLDADGEAFLIVDVLKSDAVTIQASSDSGAEAKLDVPAIQQLVGAQIQVKSASADSSSVTFRGQAPITFGFKAFAIGYAGGRWKLEGSKASAGMAFSIDPEDEGIEDNLETADPVLLTNRGMLSF